MGINPLKPSIDELMDARPGIRKTCALGTLLTKQGYFDRDNSSIWLQQ